MVVDRNISRYLVFAEEGLLTALGKISENRVGLVFVVADSGALEGVLTDGDFRRWLVGQESIRLDRPVSAAMNREFISARENAPLERIEGLLSEHIKLVPLLDGQGRLVAVATRGRPLLRIGDIVVDDDAPTFVIAEIGNNHNGSVELAMRLVDEAIAAGANCAKFQMRSMKSLYRTSTGIHGEGEDLGAEYTLDLLARFQLGVDEMLRVFDYCCERGVLPLCTPWDPDSLAVLDRYGIKAFKVASADLTNHELLDLLAHTRKPLICSTGMSTEAEIADAVRLLRRRAAQFALLHCNSTYPAPFKDIHLRYLDRLRQIGDCPVGYSGHERGTSVAIAAVAMGARIVEKHFTLDRGMEGNDHRVSLLPLEFSQMVAGIREVETAMGNGETRAITQGELINREVLGKSLVAAADLMPGTLVTEDVVAVRSPGRGLPPYRKRDLVGKVLLRRVRAGDFFYPSDVEAARFEPRPFRFSRPFGVPVRYHDFETIARASNLDLVEFHLSYKDLELDPLNYVRESVDMDVVVHAPELFAGDHLMDLCSPDPAYRARSISELDRVVNTTRRLAPRFARATRPLIVINAGGFTLDAPIPVEQRAERYALVAAALREIDAEGVEIIPQTMPPFPWHFGGQRFHNLFMDAEEIVAFAREHGTRYCLDVSHSKLACNHSGASFAAFLEVVSPHTAHLHVVDARGVDGEGLQIGSGEVDFGMVSEIARRACPDASFVPEIWQGHKSGGAGFWEALDKLERWF